jgi:hypothetical protein
VTNILIFYENNGNVITTRAARLANQSQSVSEGKKDTFKELEKLGSLKQQGILNDEEFQRLKARLLSNI